MLRGLTSGGGKHMHQRKYLDMCFLLQNERKAPETYIYFHTQFHLESWQYAPHHRSGHSLQYNRWLYNAKVCKKSRLAQFGTTHPQNFGSQGEVCRMCWRALVTLQHQQLVFSKQ